MNIRTDNPTESLWQRITAWLVKTDARNPARQRQARLAAIVLLFAELMTIIAVAARANTQAPQFISSPLAQGAILSLLILVLYLLNRRGLNYLSGVGFALFMLGIATVVSLEAGPLSPNAIAFVIPVIIAGVFGPPASAIVFAIAAGIIYLLLNLQADSSYFLSVFRGEAAVQTVVVYINLAFVALISWLFSRLAQRSFDDSQDLSIALVQQRTDLERRLLIQTRQLQATTTVARAIAGTRNLDQLLGDSVRLIRETFGYYHVQIFLVDEVSEYAVLQKSTGDIGETLLARGHRLPVGSLSVIGQVTAGGRPLIARNADADVVHRRNELLPDTRSEMAIPLTVGTTIIGALDMQSEDADAFDDEMLPTFQALADQLAVAIENARLFEQAQDNLREFHELNRDVTQRSWAEFLSETRDDEVRQVYGPEPKALEIHRSRVVERVLGAGSIVVSSGADGRQAFIAAPIIVRNEVVGVIGIEPESTREWSPEDLQLLQNIAERAALAVENTRLYVQAQRAAERERLIGDIADQLQRAPSLAILLENVTRELSDAMGTENVYAEISLSKPLAHSRKHVSEIDDDEAALLTTDEQEGAKAES